MNKSKKYTYLILAGSLRDFLNWCDLERFDRNRFKWTKFVNGALVEAVYIHRVSQIHGVDISSTSIKYAHGHQRNPLYKTKELEHLVFKLYYANNKFKEEIPKFRKIRF